ncbi:MAG: TRAP transporter substrate-binding protein [Saccharospirillum sp.]
MTNPKKRLLTASIIATTLCFAPFASADKVLKFAHDNQMDMFDNPAHAFTGVFKNIVESATNGSITVEVYPNNQLGSASEHINMVQNNIIQGTLSSVGALGGYYPRMGVLDVPFAFSSNSATYNVFDGPFGQALAADIENSLNNVKVLGFPDTGGFFSVTNSERAIETIEDFEGIRVRTMTIPSHQKIIQELGGEAYPLAWGEVYSALQTGVIDGQMNPIPTISFAKFDEVQEFVTLTNHLFAPYTLLVSEQFYSSLTDEERDIIHFAAQSGITASRGVSRVIEASERGLPGLYDKMNVNALSPQERERFRTTTQPALIEYIRETQDETGDQLLDLFLQETEAANSSRYMN